MKTDSPLPNSNCSRGCVERLVRPFGRMPWMSGTEECDWPEDAEHENGNYYNKCLACDSDFVGHKRRHICRKCHYEAKAPYKAMTPEERAAHDARIAAEIEAFYR